MKNLVKANRFVPAAFYLSAFVLVVACKKKEQVSPEEATGQSNILTRITETRMDSRRREDDKHYRFIYDENGRLISWELGSERDDIIYFSYSDNNRTVTLTTQSGNEGHSVYHVDDQLNLTHSDFFEWDGAYFGSFYYTYNTDQRLIRVENSSKDIWGNTKRRDICEFSYGITDGNATTLSYKNHDWSSWDALFNFSLGGLTYDGTISPIEYLPDRKNNLPDFLPFKAVSVDGVRLHWRNQNLLSRFGESQYEYSFDTLGRMTSMTVTTQENDGHEDYTTTVKFEFHYRLGNE